MDEGDAAARSPRPGCAAHRATPARCIAPASGRTTPPTMFISVLLPAPFWPIRPRMRPRPSARLTSRTAWMPAKALEMPASSRIGVAHAAPSLGEQPGAGDVESGGGEDDAALDHVDVEGREAHVVERVAEQDEEDDADEASS